MSDLTPEQRKEMDTWAAQRDAILKSIAEKKEEESKLIESVNNLSQAKTEIYDDIRRGEGRLEELKKKEEEFGSLTTSENAELREEKTRLQTEISGHKEEIALHEKNKANLVESISVLTALHDKVFDKVNGLESLVGGIVKIASENATQVESILITAGAELKKVIDIGEANVAKTNQLIIEIPKIIVDIHRDVIERRTIARNRLAKRGDEIVNEPLP